MKKFGILFLFLTMFLVTSPVLSASGSDNIEVDTYNYDVGGDGGGDGYEHAVGSCMDMKRDTTYATNRYHSVSGHAFTQADNCEDIYFADHYSGTGTLTLKDETTGKTLVSSKNYFSPGVSVRRDLHNLNDSHYYISTLNWDIIDNQNTSGSKVIYARIS